MISKFKLRCNLFLNELICLQIQKKLYQNYMINIIIDENTLSEVKETKFLDFGSSNFTLEISHLFIIKYTIWNENSN